MFILVLGSLLSSNICIHTYTHTHITRTNWSHLMWLIAVVMRSYQVCTLSLNVINDLTAVGWLLNMRIFSEEGFRGSHIFFHQNLLLCCLYCTPLSLYLDITLTWTYLTSDEKNDNFTFSVLPLIKSSIIFICKEGYNFKSYNSFSSWGHEQFISL